MGKVIKWCLGICAALVVALIVLVCVYLGKEWNRTTYFKNTTIDGYDVSEMTPDEVVPILKNAFTAASVSLKEGDKEEAVWSLEDLGYTVDETALKAAANEAMEKQKSSIPVLIDSMMNGNAFEIEVPFLKNAGALTSAVTVSALADERIANKNAEMTYDQESKTYSIIPEIQGTQLNDADIQHLVQLAVDDVIGGTTPEEDITVQIPQEMYLVPDVLSTDAELNMKVNTYNAYDKAVITYVFGEEKETIDWDTISNWIVFENGEGYLSEEKLREYVMKERAIGMTCHIREGSAARTGHDAIGRVGHACHGCHEEGVGSQSLREAAFAPERLELRRKAGCLPKLLQDGNRGARVLPRRIKAGRKLCGPIDTVHVVIAHSSSTLRTARNASCGTSTEPMFLMRFLPSFCFSRSLRLREMSPP